MTRISDAAFAMGGARTRIEIHDNITISTDSNGDGSTNVTFDQSFPTEGDYVAIPVLQGADGDVGVSNPSDGTVDVDVSGSSTTTGSVQVRLLVIGQQDNQ